MTPDKIQIIIESYGRLKNLKLVELETGVKWQTVYWHLKKSGVPVTGDKARYGSSSDRIAVIGEQLFKCTVPFAKDNNDLAWQPTIDFSIGEVTIDVKTASLKQHKNRYGGVATPRWAFCISKQKDAADYFVFYALCEDAKDVMHIFLMPKEIATTCTTVSIPVTLNSKWSDYLISSDDLHDFFLDVYKSEKKIA